MEQAIGGAMKDWERLVGLIERNDLSEKDLAEMIRRVAGGVLGPPELRWRPDEALEQRIKAARRTALGLIKGTSWYANNQWPPATVDFRQPVGLTLHRWLASAEKY